MGKSLVDEITDRIKGMTVISSTDGKTLTVQRMEGGKHSGHYVQCKDDEGNTVGRVMHTLMVAEK